LSPKFSPSNVNIFNLRYLNWKRAENLGFINALKTFNIKLFNQSFFLVVSFLPGGFSEVAGIIADVQLYSPGKTIHEMSNKSYGSYVVPTF